MEKFRILGVGLAALAFFISSCEEEASPTRVWGDMQYAMSAMKFSTDAGGNTLAKGGKDLYGYCKAGDTFSFAVGSDTPSPANMNSVSAYYFEVQGIGGAPTLGVYQSGETPKDNEKRAFTRGRIATGGNDWFFEGSQIDGERCYASLLAQPGDGELTPQNFGQKEFDYFVEIFCPGGLNSVPNANAGGQVLTGFQVELYFANCD